MMKQNRLICLIVIYTILLTFIPFVPAQVTSQTPGTVETKKGLIFRLREGESKTVKTEKSENPAVEKLSAAEADAIFRRLPPLLDEKSDKTDLALRESSLPPPKTGKVIPVKFAPDEVRTPPGAPNTAALEVMNSAPRGLVSKVRDLSITFSQPMIELSVQNGTSENIPVRVTPEIKGKWRWRGANTLVFEADPRFPMATKYTATIPAGTKSVSGAVLAEDFSWNFETPPAKVESFSPKDATVERDELMLAAFNQQINPEAVLPKINAVVVPNGQKIALRLASQTEIEANKEFFEKVKKLPAKSWIAFRAVEPMPLDSQINVSFETGIPSAEGALTSVLPFNYTFQTYGALKLAESDCGYQFNKDVCRPFDELRLEFTNPIDAQSFDKSLVRIDPEINNAEISIYGNQLHIGGGKQIRETYKITVSEKLRDIYGQALGEKVSAKFKTVAPEPQIYFEKADQNFVTLDPNIRQPVLSVYSNGYPNLRVKIYSVKPEDYEAFSRYKENLSNQYSFTQLPAVGKLVSDKTVKIKGNRDYPTETKINFAPALSNNLGHAILMVEPTVVTKENEDQKIVVWVEATQIGVDAFSDYEKLTVYASDLKTGKPLKGVTLQSSDETRGITTENGLGTIALPSKPAKQPGWLIARSGADAALLFEENNYGSDRTWSRDEQIERLRWFVLDDRKIYRPGETVSIKGYLRKLTGGKFTDIEALGDAARGLSYVLKDSRGNEILKGNAQLNAFGAFDFQIKLPETLNLGAQNLELTADSALASRNFSHSFQVEEFRRPEFEVTAKSETAAPFYVGASANVSVEAKYYAGGALANAATNWKVTSKPTNYTPPNRDDFTFGKFIPWWRNYSESDYEQTTTENFKGETDANGKHFLAMDFVKANPARPFSVTAEARVADVNRQTFAGSATLLVHPSELYVGIRTPKTFVKPGENLRVELIATDIDGSAVSDAPVSVVAELKDWQQIKGEWQDATIDTQTCQIKSAVVPVACEFNPKQGGRFTIKASVLDRKERRNESEMTVWSAGGNSEPVREVEKETVEMIPDKKNYKAGDVAEILINAPFYPAEGVLTLRRNGVIKTERFTMNESSTILKIPVEEGFLPNFYAQVDLFGAAKRVVFDNETDKQLPKRPAFASGALNLEVSTASRRLTVAAEPFEKTLEPGGETSVNVAVTDHNGNAAANAEVALVAVDESVLALTNYRISDPLDAFYLPLESGAADFYSRENILLASPEDLLAPEFGRGFGRGSGMGSGYGNGSGDGDGDSPTLRKSDRVFSRMEIITSLNRAPSNVKDAIRIRRNFNALAIFSPSVLTDANGKATVKINLPDNLTRYRITAVAATNAKKFGKTESAITARQSLMVRPSAPRFMNLGDKAELPVVLQNQTDQPLTVNVAIRAANANLTDGGRRVTIAANDRAELRFPVAVASAGVARFQIGAVSGNLADAAEFAFPVSTPATTEAFATYGTTDTEGAVIYPVTAPEGVFPQFGELEITTSSTQLQELTDAFIYLQSYPFECSEQVSSRILSVAALRDVLSAFHAKELPTKAEIEAKMTSDIERLRALQHADGGFSFWSSKDESIPFVSVHVAHALARAKAKGYSVPIELSRNLLGYLKNIESKYPALYSSESRRAISAYALFVRDLMGDRDAAKARKLFQDAGIENLSAESLGWLLTVFAGDQDSLPQVETIKQNLFNRAAETADTANFVTKYADGEYVLLASDRRADAVILESLLKVEPAHPLVPKIVRGLLANKIKGRWKSTQENAFVLLALDKYFQTYEKITPDFTARIWLGNDFAGAQKFSGRSTDSQSVVVPMQTLQQSKTTQNLILERQGAGRLYYRIGMKYAPQNLMAEAADFGFKVSRTYEPVDAPDDARQNPDGSWTFKSGARIRVRLQMVAPGRRYHVALVDNLPAGLEIINSALAVSESLPDDEKTQNLENNLGYYDQIWFDHQNLRDNRAEVFQDMLYAGVWNYSYVARATTPGDFVVPPAKAEQMYSPEIFGRSRTDFVHIK